MQRCKAASLFDHLVGVDSRRFGVHVITIIDGWYLTSRREDKWRARERRITFE
jgi:hypothetical protein